MKRVLSCYALGNDRGWKAICVDFDLAVQGRTLETAFPELKEHGLACSGRPPYL
jgi:hypothetical protein